MSSLFFELSYYLQRWDVASTRTKTQVHEAIVPRDDATYGLQIECRRNKKFGLTGIRRVSTKEVRKKAKGRGVGGVSVAGPRGRGRATCCH